MGVHRLRRPSPKILWRRLHFPWHPRSCMLLAMLVPIDSHFSQAGKHSQSDAAGHAPQHHLPGRLLLSGSLGSNCSPSRPSRGRVPAGRRSGAARRGHADDQRQRNDKQRANGSGHDGASLVPVVSAAETSLKDSSVFVPGQNGLRRSNADARRFTQICCLRSSARSAFCFWRKTARQTAA